MFWYWYLPSIDIVYWFLDCLKVCGMDQLWSIALRANNTDVSMTAIQILNNYYINYGNGHLEKEAEFIQRCMDNLTNALTDIESVSNECLRKCNMDTTITKHSEALQIQTLKKNLWYTYSVSISATFSDYCVQEKTIYMKISICTL